MLPTTKDRILEAGAEIIHKKGYNHTGIQEILNAANVPKGSFYNYFKNKEDFGLQIIDRFQCHFDRMAKDILEDTSIAPLKRIDRLLSASMDHFQSTDYTGGCPIGNLAQEMGDLNPAFREKLREAMDAIIGAYSRVLAEAQTAGEISEQLDVNEIAYFIVAGWHGAIIQMKLTKNLAPLENHRKFIFNHILKDRMMKSDKSKTKDELIRELKALKSKFKERSTSLEKECKERGRSEEELRLAQVIIDNSPVILFRRVAGDNPKLMYVSDNICQMGYTAREFLDDKIHFKDIVHPDDLERIGEEIRRYAEEDVEEYTQLYRFITKDGQVRWVEDQTSVVRNDKGKKIFNQGLLVDITSRKLAEEEVRKSEEKFRRIVETAGEGFLLMDENLKISEVNDAYCNLLGYSREEIIGKTPFDLATEEFRQFMTSNREEILAKEYREFEGTVVAKNGRHVPILVHGNTLRGDQGEVIGNMAFITDMTEHKKALALAGEVQKSLLPQSKPNVHGLDIAGRNVSCDEIGGDYFDFLWRRENPDGPFTVAVGDITGHGVDSALLMTSARAFLRMRASQPGSMAEVITAMNRHLTQDVLETSRFMTLFYLTVDPQKDGVDWVRAGHDPAILYDPQQDAFEELKGSGVALGVNDAFEYVANHRKGLTNGQIIAIGTDGIWEAFNKKGKMFGKQRFRDIIRQNAKGGADDILNAVYNEINQFTKGHKSEDDITLVIIKINKP